jgi:hypothetical protein
MTARAGDRLILITSELKLARSDLRRRLPGGFLVDGGSFAACWTNRAPLSTREGSGTTSTRLGIPTATLDGKLPAHYPDLATLLSFALVADFERVADQS